MAKKANVTIKLVRRQGVDQEQQDVSRGKTVQWWNKDNRAHVINFDEWPFVELPQLISLNRGKKSKIFTVYVDATKKGYSYSVVPDITKNGPPDTPSIVVGD